MANPDLPADVNDAPVGADDSLVTSLPTDYIDIRDHGAAVDGTTDDHAAVTAALDEAAQSGTPNVVYAPSGTIRLSTQVQIYGKHSGITLKGDGSTTHFRLDAQSTTTTNVNVFKIYASDGVPITDFTMRDLRIDGQGASQSEANHAGISGLVSGNGDDNCLFENLWIHDTKGNNVICQTAGTTFRYCSAWGAVDYHGFGFGSPTNDPDRPITVEYCYATDNWLYGFDASDGYTVIRKCISEHNGWGAKNTPNTVDSTWEHVILRNNTKHGDPNPGWQVPSGTADNVTMDRVLSQGHDARGFHFGASGTIDIPSKIQAVGNATPGGNIWVPGTWTFNADSGAIESKDAVDGPGLHFDSGSTGQVGELVHFNNAGGALVNDSSVTVSTQTNEDFTIISDPVNPDSSSGGSGSSPATPGTMIESWESGSVGSEWTRSNTTAIEVDNADAADGTYSLFYDGTSFGGYQHAISTSGLPTYPTKGDTILWRQKVESTNGESVFIWGAQSSTWVPNSYGVRVNLDSAGDTVSLEKDFNNLNSTSVTIPKSEWLYFELDWGDDGSGNVQLTLTIFDSSGSEVTTLSATDTGTTQYSSGGIGIEWNDGSETTIPRLDAISLASKSSSYVNVGGTTTQHTMYVNEGGTATPYSVNIGSTQ